MTRFNPNRLAIKTFIVTITSLFFIQSTAFVHAAETNIWQQRRGALEAAAESQKQLAETLNNPATTVASLPKVDPGLAMPFSQKALSDIGLNDSLSLKEKSNLASDVIPGWMQSAIAPNATIQSIHLSQNPEAKKVLLMQDAHLLIEAQTHIAATIDSLGRELESRDSHLLVGLEGADVDEGDFSQYNELTDRKILKDVAQALLKEHVLNGVEYAAIGYQGKDGTSAVELPFTVTGVELREEYEKNVKALQEATPIKPEAKKALEEFRRTLVELKAKHYDMQLHKLDARMSKYKLGSLSVPDYVLYLDSIIPAKSENTRELIEASLIEGTLNFSKVEREREQMLSQLLGKLSQDETKTLLAYSALYRAGQMSYGNYYENLKQLCKKKGVSFAQYPEMSLYIQYVLKSEAIDADQLFKDLEILERDVQDKLIRTKEQRELAELTHDYHMFLKLVDHVLTEDEWNTYKRRAEKIETLESRLASLDGTSPDLLSKFLKDWRTVLENFYNSAIARNDHMVEKLSNKLASHKTADTAILVAGGFHTQGLLKGFKAKDYTVLTLSPKITKIEKGLSSLDILASGQMPLDRLFAGDRLFLGVMSQPLSWTENLRVRTLDLIVSIYKALLSPGKMIQTGLHSTIAQSGQKAVPSAEASAMTLPIRNYQVTSSQNSEPRGSTGQKRSAFSKIIVISALALTSAIVFFAADSLGLPRWLLGLALLLPFMMQKTDTQESEDRSATPRDGFSASKLVLVLSVLSLVFLSFTGFFDPIVILLIGQVTGLMNAVVQNIWYLAAIAVSLGLTGLIMKRVNKKNLGNFTVLFLALILSLFAVDQAPALLNLAGQNIGLLATVGSVGLAGMVLRAKDILALFNTPYDAPINGADQDILGALGKLQKDDQVSTQDQNGKTDREKVVTRIGQQSQRNGRTTRRSGNRTGNSTVQVMGSLVILAGIVGVGITLAQGYLNLPEFLLLMIGAGFGAAVTAVIFLILWSRSDEKLVNTGLDAVDQQQATTNQPRNETNRDQPAARVQKPVDTNLLKEVFLATDDSVLKRVLSDESEKAKLEIIADRLANEMARYEMWMKDREFTNPSSHWTHHANQLAGVARGINLHIWNDDNNPAQQLLVRNGIEAFMNHLIIFVYQKVSAEKEAREIHIHSYLGESDTPVFRALFSAFMDSSPDQEFQKRSDPAILAPLSEADLFNKLFFEENLNIKAIAYPGAKKQILEILDRLKNELRTFADWKDLKTIEGDDYRSLLDDLRSLVSSIESDVQLDSIDNAWVIQRRIAAFKNHLNIFLFENSSRIEVTYRFLGSADGADVRHLRTLIEEAVEKTRLKPYTETYVILRKVPAATDKNLALRKERSYPETTVSPPDSESIGVSESGEWDLELDEPVILHVASLGKYNGRVAVGKSGRIVYEHNGQLITIDSDKVSSHWEGLLDTEDVIVTSDDRIIMALDSQVVIKNSDGNENLSPSPIDIGTKILHIAYHEDTETLAIVDSGGRLHLYRLNDAGSLGVSETQNGLRAFSRATYQPIGEPLELAIDLDVRGEAKGTAFSLDGTKVNLLFSDGHLFEFDVETRSPKQIGLWLPSSDQLTGYSEQAGQPVTTPKMVALADDRLLVVIRGYGVGVVDQSKMKLLRIGDLRSATANIGEQAFYFLTTEGKLIKRPIIEDTMGENTDESLDIVIGTGEMEITDVFVAGGKTYVTMINPGGETSLGVVSSAEMSVEALPALEDRTQISGPGRDSKENRKGFTHLAVIIVAAIVLALFGAVFTGAIDLSFISSFLSSNKLTTISGAATLGGAFLVGVFAQSTNGTKNGDDEDHISALTKGSVGADLVEFLQDLENDFRAWHANQPNDQLETIIDLLEVAAQRIHLTENATQDTDVKDLLAKISRRIKRFLIIDLNMSIAEAYSVISQVQNGLIDKGILQAEKEKEIFLEAISRGYDLEVLTIVLSDSHQRMILAEELKVLSEQLEILRAWIWSNKTTPLRIKRARHLGNIAASIDVLQSDLLEGRPVKNHALELIQIVRDLNKFVLNQQGPEYVQVAGFLLSEKSQDTPYLTRVIGALYSSPNKAALAQVVLVGDRNDAEIAAHIQNLINELARLSKVDPTIDLKTAKKLLKKVVKLIRKESLPFNDPVVLAHVLPALVMLRDYFITNPSRMAQILEYVREFKSEQTVSSFIQLEDPTPNYLYPTLTDAVIIFSNHWAAPILRGIGKKDIVDVADNAQESKILSSRIHALSEELWTLGIGSDYDKELDDIIPELAGIKSDLSSNKTENLLSDLKEVRRVINTVVLDILKQKRQTSDEFFGLAENQIEYPLLTQLYKLPNKQVQSTRRPVGASRTGSISVELGIVLTIAVAAVAIAFFGLNQTITLIETIGLITVLFLIVTLVLGGRHVIKNLARKKQQQKEPEPEEKDDSPNSIEIDRYQVGDSGVKKVDQTPVEIGLEQGGYGYIGSGFVEGEVITDESVISALENAQTPTKPDPEDVSAAFFDRFGRGGRYIVGTRQGFIYQIDNPAGWSAQNTQFSGTDARNAVVIELAMPDFSGGPIEAVFVLNGRVYAISADGSVIRGDYFLSWLNWNKDLPKYQILGKISKNERILNVKVIAKKGVILYGQNEMPLAFLTFPPDDNKPEVRTVTATAVPPSTIGNQPLFMGSDFEKLDQLYKRTLRKLGRGRTVNMSELRARSMFAIVGAAVLLGFVSPWLFMTIPFIIFSEELGHYRAAKKEKEQGQWLADPILRLNRVENTSGSKYVKNQGHIGFFLAGAIALLLTGDLSVISILVLAAFAKLHEEGGVDWVGFIFSLNNLPERIQGAIVFTPLYLLISAGAFFLLPTALAAAIVIGFPLAVIATARFLKIPILTKDFWMFRPEPEPVPEQRYSVADVGDSPGVVSVLKERLGRDHAAPDDLFNDLSLMDSVSQDEATYLLRVVLQLRWVYTQSTILRQGRAIDKVKTQLEAMEEDLSVADNVKRVAAGLIDKTEETIKKSDAYKEDIVAAQAAARARKLKSRGPPPARDYSQTSTYRTMLKAQSELRAALAKRNNDPEKAKTPLHLKQISVQSRDDAKKWFLAVAAYKNQNQNYARAVFEAIVWNGSQEPRDIRWFNEFKAIAAIALGFDANTTPKTVDDIFELFIQGETDQNKAKDKLGVFIFRKDARVTAEVLAIFLLANRIKPEFPLPSFSNKRGKKSRVLERAKYKYLTQALNDIRIALSDSSTDLNNPTVEQLLDVSEFQAALAEVVNKAKRREKLIQSKPSKIRAAVQLLADELEAKLSADSLKDDPLAQQILVRNLGSLDRLLTRYAELLVEARGLDPKFIPQVKARLIFSIESSNQNSIISWLNNSNLANSGVAKQMRDLQNLAEQPISIKKKTPVADQKGSQSQPKQKQLRLPFTDSEPSAAAPTPKGSATKVPAADKSKRWKTEGDPANDTPPDTEDADKTPAGEEIVDTDEAEQPQPDAQPPVPNADSVISPVTEATVGALTGEPTEYIFNRFLRVILAGQVTQADVSFIVAKILGETPNSTTQLTPLQAMKRLILGRLSGAADATFDVEWTHGLRQFRFDFQVQKLLVTLYNLAVSRKGEEPVEFPEVIKSEFTVAQRNLQKYLFDDLGVSIEYEILKGDNTESNPDGIPPLGTVTGFGIDNTGVKRTAVRLAVSPAGFTKRRDELGKLIFESAIGIWSDYSLAEANDRATEIILIHEVLEALGVPDETLANNFLADRDRMVKAILQSGLGMPAFLVNRDPASVIGQAARVITQHRQAEAATSQANKIYEEEKSESQVQMDKNIEDRSRLLDRLYLEKGLADPNNRRRLENRIPNKNNRRILSYGNIRLNQNGGLNNDSLEDAVTKSESAKFLQRIDQMVESGQMVGVGYLGEILKETEQLSSDDLVILNPNDDWRVHAMAVARVMDKTGNADNAPIPPIVLMGSVSQYKDRLKQIRSDLYINGTPGDLALLTQLEVAANANAFIGTEDQTLIDNFNNSYNPETGAFDASEILTRVISNVKKAQHQFSSTVVISTQLLYVSPAASRQLGELGIQVLRFMLTVPVESRGIGDEILKEFYTYTFA